MVDYQGVVVAMTVLPGEAESACFIHKHKPLGDNRGYGESPHIQVGDKTRLATWNCGSYVVRWDTTYWL